MPWSPVPKFPTIIKHIQGKGYVKQVNYAALRRAIIIETGLTSESAISKTIGLLEELEYIKADSNSASVWNIIYNENKDVEEDEEINRIINIHQKNI